MPPNTMKDNKTSDRDELISKLFGANLKIRQLHHTLTRLYAKLALEFSEAISNECEDVRDLSQ